MHPGEARTGGVRKLRKRGGLRVIYFVRYQPNEFWKLILYAKPKQGAGPYSETTEGGIRT